MDRPTREPAEHRDPLDDLIRRAARCEVDPHAVDRLTETWSREMRGPLALRRWLPLAAAAVLGIVAGTVILFVSWPRDDARRSASGGPEQAIRQEQDDAVSVGPEKTPPEISIDRDSPKENEPGSPAATEGPTPYELVIMHAALERGTSRIERPTRSIRRELVGYLASLESIEEHTAERVAMDLDVSAGELEAEIGQLCLALRGPRRPTAVELFAHVATERSLDVLVRLWNQPAHQVQVAPALARLADTTTLARCYLQASSSRSRRIVAETLVEQLSAADAGLVLNLLSRPHGTAELIAALREADGLLEDVLFAELDSENRAARFAAARTLGALNQPSITQRLIDRVLRGERRQEALVALAASDEPTAVQFVSQVRQDAVLAASLQSALVQSRTSQPWYGG